MKIFAWNCPIQSSSILSLDCPVFFTPDFACTSFAQEANLLRPKVPFWQVFQGDESAGGLKGIGEISIKGSDLTSWPLVICDINRDEQFIPTYEDYFISHELVMNQSNFHIMPPWFLTLDLTAKSPVSVERCKPRQSLTGHPSVSRYTLCGAWGWVKFGWYVATWNIWHMGTIKST